MTENPLESTELRRQVKKHLECIQDMGITEMRDDRVLSLRKGFAGGLNHRHKPSLAPPDLHGNITLEKIREDIGECTRCRLHEKRTHIVFGTGDLHAQLMFIGEAPGHDEDIKGEPFVGRAGQLLTKMIEAMGYKRSDVYIANIVKCRPPDNRYPEPDESKTCYPFLLQQIDAIKPKMIVSLGNLATQTLLETKTGITALHGTFRNFHGTTLMPTYHPAFLLRNPNMKKPCWEDLKKVIEFLKV